MSRSATGSRGVATTVVAPAKLTLRLSITGVRADGYHLIDAEMVSLDLCDVLHFADGDSLVVVDEVGRGSAVPADEGNLVRRALATTGRRAAVTLHKRIPAGGGLGGGSSDAAAVLRWASCYDVAVATTLGADVPFCLIGGRARVRGIGEVVEALPVGEVAGASYTLLTPPFGVSTADVYRNWDAMGGPTGARNDLEVAALAVEPRLARWRDKLGDASGQMPTLAGSGSTWFVPGDHPGEGHVPVRVYTPGADGAEAQA